MFTLLLSLAAAGTPQDPSLRPPSVHQLHREQPPTVAPRSHPPLPPAQGTHARWVYGYFPSWVGDLDDVPWEHITHIALFAVDLTSTGDLDDEHIWEDLAPQAVSLAAPHGVKVHLTLTCFDDAVMESVLGDPGKRAKTVERLGTLVDQQGADGVSVDCEGMPAHLKDELVLFVGELADRVDEVTVATPAIDWAGAYDYDQLALASDALFIMGYGYHWSGGNPGPNAPLEGGETWGKYDLQWSIQDHLDNGAPADRVILGLPTYGRDWPSESTSVPGTATGKGSAVTMSQAQRDYAGLERRYDAVAENPYWFPSSTRQAWVDDVGSLDAKMGLAEQYGLRGFGFWALGYEGGDPAFWAAVDANALADEPQDTGTTGEDDTGSSSGDDTGRRGSTTNPESVGRCSVGGQSGAALSLLLGLAALLSRRREGEA